MCCCPLFQAVETSNQLFFLATTQGLQPAAATISSLCRQGQGQDIDVAGGCWCFVVVFDVDVGNLFRSWDSGNGTMG